MATATVSKLSGLLYTHTHLAHTHGTSQHLIHCLSDTRRRRPMGCLKLQVIFRKRATNYRALLRKMTYGNKASYGSSPPCTAHLFWKEFCIHLLRSNVAKSWAKRIKANKPNVSTHEVKKIFASQMRVRIILNHPSHAIDAIMIHKNTPMSWRVVLSFQSQTVSVVVVIVVSRSWQQIVMQTLTSSRNVFILQSQTVTVLV